MLIATTSKSSSIDSPHCWINLQLRVTPKDVDRYSELSFGSQEIYDYVVKRSKGDIDANEFGLGRTKIFVKSPDTIWKMEEMLEQKMDPEGYKLKVKNFKESEARAKKAQGSVGLKSKCNIM